MASAASVASARNHLSELITAASARKNPRAAYVGEITPVEAYAYLVKEGGMLVDVRTIPEWKFVGMADLDGCKGHMAAVCWKNYPDMMQNPAFVEQLSSTGIDKDTPLFFMCRGGGRSAEAAHTMAQQGYTHCFNVATGFEGEADEQGHRGRKSGWQGLGLPWKH